MQACTSIQAWAAIIHNQIQTTGSWVMSTYLGPLRLLREKENGFCYILIAIVKLDCKVITILGWIVSYYNIRLDCTVLCNMTIFGWIVMFYAIFNNKLDLCGQSTSPVFLLTLEANDCVLTRISCEEKLNKIFYPLPWRKFASQTF